MSSGHFRPNQRAFGPFDLATSRAQTPDSEPRGFLPSMTLDFIASDVRIRSANKAHTKEKWPMRVAVVGSTGVLGRYLIPRLIERKHRVRAVVRDEKRAALLRHMGAEVVLGDILDPDSMIVATNDCDAVLHIATN